MRAIIFLFIGLLLASPAMACTDPVGDEGLIVFNTTENVPQYCDGTNWIAMTSGVDTQYIPNGAVFGSGIRLSHNTPVGMVDSKQFTMSFWFYLAGMDGHQIFRIDTSTGADINFSINSSQNNIWWTMANASAVQILRLRSTDALLQAGRWYHYMASVDLSDTNRRHVYINGQDASTALQAHTDEVFQTSTANSITLSNSGVNFYDGRLADFWFDAGTYIDLSNPAERAKFINNGNPVYLGGDGSRPTGTAPDIFLSGDTANWHTNKGTAGGFTEIGALTTSTTSPYTPRTEIVPSGLVGHWRLDETSGTAASDSSGNGNTGTLVGTTFAASTITGTNGNAISLPGNGDHVLINDNNQIEPATALTVSAWIKADVTPQPANAVILTKRWNNSANPWNSYALDTTPSGDAIQFCASTGVSGSQVCATWAGGLTTDWQHVTGVFDGTNIRLYVDGILRAGPTAFVGPIGYSTDNLYIGWSSWGGRSI